MSNFVVKLNVFLLITLCCFKYGTTMWTARAYRNINYNLADIQAWTISQTNLVTLSTCLLLCLPLDNCLGIMYQDTTGNCHLLSLDYTEINIQSALSVGVLISTIPQPGEWVYYQAVKDCNPVDCPVGNGYTFIAEICMCIKYNKIELLYGKAGEYCLNGGGELLKINSSLKQLYIEHYFDQFDSSDVTDRVYIQGQKTGDRWYFDDGTEMKYFNWRQNQPNNGVSENIIFISPKEKSVWDDGFMFKYSFVCEIKL